uniref:Uncharacterized protein n=1 Tax=Globodera rostochiensis TaxID=31243 RepID=A0A914HWE8_GLORO
MPTQHPCYGLRECRPTSVLTRMPANIRVMVFENAGQHPRYGLRECRPTSVLTRMPANIRVMVFENAGQHPC